MSREQLLEKGWRRHSVISPSHDAITALLPYLPEVVIGIASVEGAVILISTYDCAVVNPCFSGEPWVQLLVAFPADYQKKFSKGRDPRRLHFLIGRDGNSACYETNASCICQVKRDLLLEIEPDLPYLVSDSDKYDLKNWLAERFRQDTWPDAFNFALKPAEKKLKKFWVRYNDFISGMYIKLNTYDELEDGRYSVSIIVAIESGKQRKLISKVREVDKNMRDKSIDEVMARIENEVLNAFGNTVSIDEDRTKLHGKAIEIIDENVLSVHQLRHFPRFSPYSLSEFDSDAPPPVDLVPARVH